MPATYVKNGGTFSPVLQPYVRNAGTWSPVLAAYVKTGGSWSLVFTGFTASAAPTSGIGTSFLSTVTSTDTFVASTTGGVGPFTYLWTKVSGDTINANSPTNSSTVFSATSMSPDEIRSAVYKCVVTDTTTLLSQDTNTVSITLTRLS